VTEPPSLRELRVTELLDALAGSRVPSSGSAAALTGAMAAELVAMTARAATGWADAPGVAAQARTLSARLVPLATSDAEAFTRVVELRADPTADPRDLGPALQRAADIPLAIADAAAATAELAAFAAGWVVGHEKSDAVAAAALAEGATRAATALVHANLATRPGDTRSKRADELVRAAADARAAALAAL
jgi:methenyltetrahydrofolate cyclohydrolase